MDLSTGAMFSNDFCDFGDFGGLGWSWVVSGSRFLGFVDRCNVFGCRFLGFVDRCSVFEGPGEREPVGARGSLLEPWSFLSSWRNEHGLLGRCVYIYGGVLDSPNTVYTQGPLADFQRVRGPWGGCFVRKQTPSVPHRLQTR